MKLKCLTHGGTIHADEKLAIAWLELHYGQEAEVIFSYNPTPEQLADPELHVLDVGKTYDKKSNNRDHHQDGNLPATNLMVLRDFPHPIEAVNSAMEEWLFGYVDRVDRGEIVEKGKGAITLNTLIRMVNSVPGLDDVGRHEAAMNLIRPILSGLVGMAIYAYDPFGCAAITSLPGEPAIQDAANTRLQGVLTFPFFQALVPVAESPIWTSLALSVIRAATAKRIADETRWAEEVIVIDYYAIHDSTDQISDWREYAEAAGVTHLLTPNLRGGWQIITISSETHPIPAHPSQTYLHAAKFLAVYPDWKTAMAHVRTLK